MMVIDFTEYVLPNGLKRHVQKEVSDEVGEMALKLELRGYTFEFEVLTTGQTSFTICGSTRNGNINDVDTEISKTGSVEAIEKLITRFYERIAK
jgi:hypothetical protein